MTTRRPARLAKNRHGVFCLRWIVPPRFRDAQGKPKEVRISLRTRDLRRARILAMELNLAYERALLMSPAFDPRSLTQPWTLSVGDLKVDVQNDQDLASFNQFLDQHPDIKQAMLKKIEQGMSADQVAAQFQNLMTQTAAPIAAALLEVRPQLNALASGTPSGVTPVKLTDAVDTFTGTRSSLSNSQSSTATEKRRTLDLLLDYLQRSNFDLTKTCIHELGRAQFVDFVHDYSSRSGKTSSPSTKNKGGRPPKSDDSLAARTVLKAIGHLKEFCVYAQARQMMAANPLDAAFDAAVAGLRKKAASARKNNSYKAFSIEALKQIFDPETFLASNSAADYFWGPLLGLFTGARLGELVTRTVDDIRIDPRSGLLVIEILSIEDGASGNGGKNKLKNDNSRRIVPIAQPLLDMGFDRYVEHVRSIGGVKLFPHLKDGTTRGADPSKNQSRQFTKYLTDIGLKRSDLVFHSFRHTMITVMHVRQVPLKDAELIAGHAAQDTILRLESASGSTRMTWNATQPNTYIHADQFENDGETLMSRLKGHIDRTLTFDLDFAGLRSAAEIVRKNVIAERSGTEIVFRSGWHTNAKAYGAQMLSELKEARMATKAPE